MEEEIEFFPAWHFCRKRDGHLMNIREWSCARQLLAKYQIVIAGGPVFAEGQRVSSNYVICSEHLGCKQGMPIRFLFNHIPGPSTITYVSLDMKTWCIGGGVGGGGWGGVGVEGLDCICFPKNWSSISRELRNYNSLVYHSSCNADFLEKWTFFGFHEKCWFLRMTL